MKFNIKNDFHIFWKNVKKVNILSRRYNWLVVLSTVISLIQTGFSLWTPVLLSTARNIIFDGINYSHSFNSIDTEALTFNFVLYGSIVLLNALVSVAKNLLDSYITQDFIKSLRKKIAHKVTSCQVDYILHGSKGDYISRVTNDVEVIGGQFASVFSSFLTSMVTLIVSFFVLLSSNWLLTLVVLLIVPVTTFVSSRVVKFTQKFIVKGNKLIGKVDGFVEEQLNALDIINVFNKKSQSLDEFEELNSKLYENTFKGRFYDLFLSPLVSIINNLAYILVVIIGALSTIYGYFTVGGIQLFIQYMGNFSNPVNNIANLINGVQNLASCTDRVLEFLNYPDEESDKVGLVDNLEWNDANHNQVSIKFKDVSFSYDKTPVLKNLSFDVRKGQSVAIVGPTGSGKTTITKLLMKFYKVNDGSIYIYGNDLNKINASQVRDLISYVLQDIWIPKTSIRSAITYDDTNVDEQKFKLACKMSCCDQFVSSLKEGYDYIVDMDSHNLSAGQLQLITIARALYFGNEIFVFDEATSNVDTKTEKLVYEAFDNLAKNHTCIIVAHRLSTILKADKILVLNNGAIVEQGTHNELMNKHGFYYDIFSPQFKREK